MRLDTGPLGLEDPAAGRTGAGRMDVECDEADGGLRARGLLHDLGHGLATLSYLVDAVNEDPSLSDTARDRLGLMEQELARLLDLADRGLRSPASGPCDLREAVEQLVSLTAVATDTSVRLLPCSATLVHTDRSVAHRMLGNVLDNAVRAAGPDGVVEVAIIRTRDGAATVEIADNGPGFGRGPGGTASLGLGIVVGLAKACAANLYIGPAQPRGTRVRLTFPNAV